ncbi:MAG: hypothetical protein ABI972_06945 [Acidobacteriota bacterium]
MNGLFRVAEELQRFCDGQGWRSCFIGGIAVQRWGEPRITRDADMTLLAGFGEEARFVDSLLAHYRPRIRDAREFALRHRVLLLGSPDGVGIDISLAALAYESLVVERASDFEFEPGVSIRTCSAEDLIVLKLFAGRPLDLRDAEGVSIRHRGHLDWGYVENQLTPLAEAKEDPGILREMDRLRGA